MEDLTLEQLYQLLKQMRKVKENRNKKVQIWFWSKKAQTGACAFDKAGAVIDARNYWETREESSTIPVIKIEER